MMFVKQIDKEEALRLAAKGIEIQVLAPNTPESNGWMDYYADTLSNMLDGCLFFRREPAMEAAGFEQAVIEMEGNKGMAAGGQQEPDACGGDKENALKALRDVVWSMRKIADEMGLSASAMCEYLNRADEEEAVKRIAESR